MAMKNSNNRAFSKEDTELLRKADLEFAEQRHFRAAAYLLAVSDKSLLTAHHYRILQLAAQAQRIKKELMQPNPENKGWTKQGETHGNRNTCIYYRVLAGNAITSRVETPIESSLLVPLLAVLNESDLYHTWMPNWKHPRFGMSESTCLREIARGHQIVRVRIDLPLFFANRELIQHAFSVDSVDEDCSVVVKIDSLDEGVTEGVEIGKTPKGFRRVDFHAGMLIRPCPPDHPALKNRSSCSAYPDGEPLLLFSLMQQMDSHLAGVPMGLINFLTRTAIGQQWGTLLQVAEDVRDGRRPLHRNAIREKDELYGWVNRRFAYLADKLKLQQPILE